MSNIELVLGFFIFDKFIYLHIMYLPITTYLEELFN